MTKAPWAVAAGPPPEATRAPWAAGPQEATRAPWAAGGAANMPPPTRAPWAAPVAPAARAAVASSAAPEGPVDENVPRKRIHCNEDLDIFVNSRLHEQFLSFAAELSGAIRGLECSPERREAASPVIRSLAAMLDEMERWVDEIPPIEQPMRFGNKAFRLWHVRLAERAERLLLEALQQGPPPNGVDFATLAAELSHYLRASFGDETRIDYGTGHEAAFFALIFALGSRGVLAKADAPDAVLVVFHAYVRVMRRLQTVYVLEPAGSHGVWGLDDFHALPFLFGAAQLDGMEEDIPTGSVAQERTIKDHAASYLYIDAINQILLAKRGAPFSETSPMLYDITAVPTWAKIHSGLVRMYAAEVLGKFPVFQHFLFGPSIRWAGDEPNNGRAAPRTPAAPLLGEMPPPQGGNSRDAGSSSRDAAMDVA